MFLDPLFDWPTNPIRIAKWFFGIPGFLLPWFGLFIILITVSYFFFTPEMVQMESFHIGWMFEILVRNIVLMWAFTGVFHLWLYSWRKQGRLKNIMQIGWQKTAQPFYFGIKLKIIFSGQWLEQLFGQLMNVACDGPMQMAGCPI